MEQHSLTRTELLVGSEGLKTLSNSRVVIFGVGGVGSFVVEALVRAGVGNLILVDNDTVCITNLNRQIHATYNTVGKVKVEAMKERVLTISKDCNVITHQIFVNAENISDIISEDVDYVVDAIDTVTSKIALVEYCSKNNIKIISSMGTGNKFDPTMFKISNIDKTKVCPLAKVMRTELKKRGIKKLKVLYSEEIPTKPNNIDIEAPKTGFVKRQTPGSISFVPPVAGMIIAGEVIKELLDLKK